jgi:hypothetical protein
VTREGHDDVDASRRGLLWPDLEKVSPFFPIYKMDQKKFRYDGGDTAGDIGRAQSTQTTH